MAPVLHPGHQRKLRIAQEAHQGDRVQVIGASDVALLDEVA